jgi:hypothetical protein
MSSPWGYINEKRKAEAAYSEVSGLKDENKRLKETIKRLLSKELTEEEKKEIKEILI